MAAPAFWFARHDLTALLRFSPIDAAGVLRLTLALIPAGAAALTPSARNRQAYSRLIFQAALVITLCYAVGSMAYGVGTPLRAPLLAAAVMYVGLPNTLWRQIVPPLAMSAVLLATDSLPLPAVVEAASGQFAFAAFNGLGCLAVWRRLKLEHHVEQAWRREFDARLTAERALAELDQLRGIIPICSHCRRVRTEVGSWQQIEQYVRDRSSADFSHGICPSCFTVHYADAASGA